MSCEWARTSEGLVIRPTADWDDPEVPEAVTVAD
jgi:hypothetical protein